MQRGEGMPLATAATRSAEIPPPAGRGQRMTNLAWTSAGTRGPDPAPSGGQQQAPRRPVPGRDRIRPLSSPDIHARRGRETSDDRSSLRSRARPRDRSSSPPGRSIITTLPPPQPRILGRRYRSASRLSGRSGVPSQRLRATFAEDNQRRTALTQREGAPGVGVNRPRSTPTRIRNVPPLPHIIGVRRGRETSDDRPSPRPSSRPRHRPPSLPLSQPIASARAWSNRAGGGGDWFAIGSRLSGRRQTLWE